MSPYEIGLILHVHCRADPLPDAPILANTMTSLIESDLVSADPSKGCGYALTERGRAYVHFLCSMPFPQSNWTIPGPFVFSYRDPA